MLAVVNYVDNLVAELKQFKAGNKKKPTKVISRGKLKDN
jgi:hypothetical protein